MKQRKNFMKLPPQIENRKNASLNMTPMIDVVFLLIIFFIVTNSMMQHESSMSMDLPGAQSGEERKQNENTDKIILNIPNENTVYWGTRPISPSELNAGLRQLRKTASRPVQIRIRADRNVPYRAVSPILTACAKAGIYNVSFSVISESVSNGISDTLSGNVSERAAQ